MGKSPSKSRTEAVGNICELTFAAISESLNCVAFFPVGAARNIDIVLITPTHRKICCQVKGQSTNSFCTVDLRSKDHGALDLVAIFNEHHGGWFLVPGKKVKGKRTLSAREAKKYKGNWGILK